MFSTEEYIFSWFFYLSATAGLFLVVWRITRNISWHYIRQLLRLSIVVFLLTPYAVNESSHYLAPAWTIAGLDMVFSEVGNFWRAGGPLLMIWFAAVILHSLATLVYKALKISS